MALLHSVLVCTSRYCNYRFLHWRTSKAKVASMENKHHVAVVVVVEWVSDISLQYVPCAYGHKKADISYCIYISICLSDSVYIWITFQNQYNSFTPASVLERYSVHKCVESESWTITIQNSTPHKSKRFWLRFHQHEPEVILIPTLAGVTVGIVISFTPGLNHFLSQ